MATVVQIELKVDEKGAVSGVLSFDSSIKSTTANVKQLNAALAETSAAAAGSTLKTMEREFTGGESSLRTMNAEIRSLQGGIFADTRAMAEFLATIKGVGAAMELAFPVFGIMATVGVLVEAGEKAYELEGKYLSITRAQEDYNQELEKSRKQDFGNPRSIEDTRARIEEATQALREYQAYEDRQNKAANSGLSLISLPDFLTHQYLASDASKKVVEREKELASLKGAASEQDHQQRLQEIELEHALDGELQGQKKINAELDKRRELAAEARQYHAEQSAAKGNTVSPDSGKSEMEMADAIAQREADAQTFDLRREQANEIRRLQEQALESGLRGEALYQAQMNAAIADLKEKRIATDTAVNAVTEKFHNEQVKRLHDEADATQMFQARAALAGFTGIAKTQAEGDIEVGTLRAKELPGKENKTFNAGIDAEIAASQAETRAQILQQERQFTEQVDQLAEQSASRQISGFARIRAEGTKQLDELQKKFDETYGHMDRSAPGGEAAYQQGVAALHRGQASISSGTRDQINELAERNAAETQQIEDAARIRSLNGEKQKTAAIEAEYKQRLDKYDEELRQQEISWKDYNRRVVAAGEMRDAELEAQAKEAQQKMAGEFESFFKGMNHPLQELASLGEKQAGQAAAEMMTRLQQHTRGGAPARHTGLLAGIFGRGRGRDHLAEMPGQTISTAARSVFSVSSATIHVGAAQIAFGGGSGFSGGSGSGSGSFGATTFSGATGFGGGGSGFFGGTGGGGSSSGAGGPGIVGNFQTGMDLTHSAMGIFGGSKSSGLQTTNPVLKELIPNADGSANTQKTGGMLTGGGFGSNAMGAAGGALGLFSAYEGNGGVGGALGGAMSGMKLGMAVSGPIGAAVGAAAGAVIGAIGFGGREKARVYDLKQVRPRITADQDSYAQGGMDYLSAYSDMQSLDMEAKKATNKMGPAAQSYYQDTIKGEIHKAEQRFTREQKAGRSMYTASSASYAVGTDFVPFDMQADIHKGERIFTAADNRQITNSITGIHRSYEAAVRNGRSASSPRTIGDTHIHLHAIDAKSGVHFLMANKHHIRAAVNASYAENSGGSDA